ncbi:hypothetical protein ACR6EC_22150 [Bacillus subtilis]|uniref:hypothetical protein n=1 Tax=Bacillus subtilis TaxID=1423 RepID=UPI000C7881B6|nr:hypothetical protein [Bacillus subtilis]WIT27634.1 hypothetical protein [Bacillus phage SPbetaL5]MCR1990263.1 hypothetical protein [Bacillus subtilis]MDQ4711909.1 hypothetical protein [Bacillus subtilis]PLV35577.1 hypothetical protein BSP4_07010 [Bacillus subtilis subsp. subtilis]CAF1847145.1 hypothetical protein NRS6131_03966 [Bacillus subtilis]
MIQVYKYNENFMFVEPLVVTEMDEKGDYIFPDNCTSVPLPDSPSYYLPRFDLSKQVWIETASQEYIDSLSPPPEEPSDVELLGQSLAEARILILKQNRLIFNLQNEVKNLKDGTTA